MKKNFKLLATLLAFALLFALPSRLGFVQADEKKTVTVTTSFLEDMVENLVGDKVNVELIIPAGQDPHLYEAKPGDLDKITKADLLLYHGLHFEGKMVEILEQKGLAVSKEFPQEKILKMVEEDENIEVTDPHFWFDIELYKLACKEAAKGLGELLPEEKESIDKNLESYTEKLTELDGYIKEKVALLPEESRCLVTPHDAFQYFSRSYGFEVLAPQGVSTDSEVANKDIEDVARKIVEKKIKAIFAESSTNPQRMKKLQEVVKSMGGEVKVLADEEEQLFSDSLAAKGQHGDNYIDMYKHNIDLIIDNLK